MKSKTKLISKVIFFIRELSSVRKVKASKAMLIATRKAKHWYTPVGMALLSPSTVILVDMKLGLKLPSFMTSTVMITYLGIISALFIWMTCSKIIVATITRAVFHLSSDKYRKVLNKFFEVHKLRTAVKLGYKGVN